MSDTTTGYRLSAAGSLDPALEGLLRVQVDDWMNGTPHPLRVYLDRQSYLRDRPDLLVELINQEVVLRQMRGETPRPEDYLAEFPELSDSLVRLFEVHAAASLPTDWHDGQAGVSAPIEGVGRLPRIPGYDIERVLGRGGMGVVYLARHGVLDRHVALKLLKESQGDDPAHLARFRREAAAAARCQHPNLVQIHDFDEHDGEFYLALEYVPGEHLGRELAGKPQPPRRAAELVETLARAIDHAHTQGVVHRDLKPANVLLTPDGQPKITDFGLAKLKDSSTQTEVGTLMGTLAYMAPEQVRAGSGETGPRTDIHALGSILYEALTGRPPYRAETPQQILHAILSEEVVPPSARQPGIPRDLEAICLKCLEKEPARRYANAADLAEDLRRFLDRRATAARRASAAERSVRWCRRNPWIAASVALLFLGASISTWLAIRATEAESTARSAAVATGIERDRARVEAGRFKAVIEFLQKDMLAQASVDNQSTRDKPADPDLKVRTALDRAAASVGERFAGQPLVEASIRQTIGTTYYELGLYAQARPHLERAIALRRGALSDDDAETYSAIHSLGVLLADDGKWTEAEQYLVPAMEGLRRTKGADDRETLEAMLNVANLYDQLEKNRPKTLALLAEALEGFKRTRGDRDLLTLRTMDNLAIAYLAEKKPAQAEELEKEVIGTMREEVGPDSPYLLGARRNLAAIYAATGRIEEAEQLLKDVLRETRKLLGDKHPATLYTLTSLAEHYMNRGMVDEVERYAGEALEGARAVLDDKHQVRAACLGFLATVYGSKADLKKLEPVLIESVDLARFRWGPDSDVTAGGNGTLGLLFLLKSEYSRAEARCREALAFRVKDDPESPERFWLELRLGVSLLGQKKFAEALPRLLAAYKGLKPREKSALPADTSELGWIIEQVGQLRDESGRPFNDVSLAKLRGDPALQAIVFDLQFPDHPFAPPAADCEDSKRMSPAAR